MTLNQFIYRMSRPLGGLKLAKFLSRNHPKILMYHRITDDPKGEGLTADQFRQQVRIIKRDFVPMTLRDLLKAHENGKVPENAVVVTFDDGYADFAEVAFPILRDEGVPVTLFITAGFVNGDLWLWPDKLKYIISRCDSKEPVLLEGLKQSYDVYKDKDRLWNDVSDYCLTLKNSTKERYIEKVSIDLGVPIPIVPPPNFRPLSWKTLEYLIDQGVDVGSHSFSHPILKKLDHNELVEEVVRSNRLIEKNLNFIPKVFCYPNGREIDYDENVQKVLEANGYDYAVTAFPSRMPLKKKLEICRYPVNSSIDIFLKTVFGLTYLGMGGWISWFKENT